MKDIKEAKKSIKLFFYLLFSTVFLFPLKALFTIMEEDFTYLGIHSVNNYTSVELWFLFIIKFLTYITFFIAGFQLISTLNFTKTVEVFSEKNIFKFHKVGRLFLLSAFIGSTSVFVKIISGTFADMKSNNDFLFSLYFLLIMGFFFIIFSKILKSATAIKKENDLTI